VVMYTWRRGTRLLFDKTRKTEVPLEPLVGTLERNPPLRVPGTAVFLTSDPTCAPTAMMHSLKHYKVLHEKNVILTIEHAGVPRADPAHTVRPPTPRAGRPPRAPGRARADRADRGELCAGAAAVRLHGVTQRAEG